MRFTTCHLKRPDLDKTRRNTFPGENYRLGIRLGHCLEDIGIPPRDCALAFASCTFPRP